MQIELNAMEASLLLNVLDTQRGWHYCGKSKEEWWYRCDLISAKIRDELHRSVNEEYKEVLRDVEKRCRGEN